MGLPPADDTGTPESAAATRLRVLLGGQSPDLVDPDQGIPADRDALDLTTYVTMMASLVARTDTRLPLSIGLFGEWGSGKSFFMGLLRARIEGFADGTDDGYHREIVQIGFNAWTYADSNLWASLGDTIFSRLVAHGTQGRHELVEERSRMLRAELDSTVARSRELEDARDRAEAEATRMRSELDDRRVEQDGRARDMLSAAASAFASRTRDSVNLQRALTRLGVHEPLAQARLLADEVRGARDDVRIWRLAVTGRRTLTVAALVLVLQGQMYGCPSLTCDDASSAPLTTRRFSWK